jgi:hypothetical protein
LFKKYFFLPFFSGSPLGGRRGWQVLAGKGLPLFLARTLTDKSCQQTLQLFVKGITFFSLGGQTEKIHGGIAPQFPPHTPNFYPV